MNRPDSSEAISDRGLAGRRLWLALWWQTVCPPSGCFALPLLCEGGGKPAGGGTQCVTRVSGSSAFSDGRRELSSSSGKSTSGSSS